MTSCSGAKPFDHETQKKLNEISENNFVISEPNVAKKGMGLSNCERKELMLESKNSKYRKNREICNVHSLRSPESHTSLKNNRVKILDSLEINKCGSNVGNFNTTESNCSQVQLKKHTNNKEAACSTDISKAMEDASINNVSDKMLDLKPHINNIEHPNYALLNSVEETKHGSFLEPAKEIESVIKQKEISATFITDLQNGEESIDLKSYSTADQSLLPDILQTLHKPVPYNTETLTNDISTSNNNNFSAKTSQECESLSISNLSQSSYLNHSYHADGLDQDSGMDHLQKLKSFQNKQSIYKLAFDENITDQSEADSRSPSPIDPESQVPSSLTNAEILIHEADSTSEAGSEDVELIPHRYESETFLNENKHMYVNKLSLAVELLRTHENLPYDNQFKRVVNDSKGEVNLGYLEDLHANALNISEVKETSDYRLSQKCVIASPPELINQVINNNAITNGFEDSLNNSCEEVREVTIETSNNQDGTEEAKAGYHRFQVQFRHYFTPRAAFVNPCLCCNIM